MRPFPTLLTALAVAALAGCATPPEVIKLSGQTRRTVNMLGDTYVTDLEQMRSFDARRAEEMNSLVRDYQLRLRELARVYEDAFEHAKAARKAQLYQEFDETANKLLTHDFWLQLRAAMDEKQTTQLIAMAENINGRTADLLAHPADNSAEANATLIMRTNALVKALLYQMVDSTFAEFAAKVNAKRRDFRAKTEEEFEPLKLDASKALSNVRPALLKADAAEPLSTRIADVQKARSSLDAAFTELDAYLTTDKWPWKDFAQGVINGLVGLGENGKLPATNLSSAAAQAIGTNAFPDFSDLVKAFSTGLAGLDNQARVSKREGETELQNLAKDTLPQLILHTLQSPKTQLQSPKTQ